MRQKTNQRKKIWRSGFDMAKHNQLGKQGEDLIADRLCNEGFSILERNYTQQFGEIDIIAQKKDLIIFVEVKTRRNPLFDMAEIITPSKQKNILSVAKHFLANHTNAESECRFDVALIDHSNEKINITYIPNAFGE